MRIASAQTPGSRLDEWRHTWKLIADLTADAAREHADILLLPECVWPAYMLASPDDYFRARNADLPGSEAFLDHVCCLAREHRIAICAGYISELDRCLTNAAVLVNPDGRVLGTHRKCFLWERDHSLFQPGQVIMPIRTSWGPVGLMICADARLPEIPATLAARGARLILQPTAWVNCGTADRPWNPQPELLIPDRAREFGLPIASASKWGAEGNTAFVGSSIICDSNGSVLARCATTGTGVIVADVEPAATPPPSIGDRLRERLTSNRPAVAPSAHAAPLIVLACGGEVARPGVNRLPNKVLAVMCSTSTTPRTTAESNLINNLPPDESCTLIGPTPDVFSIGQVRGAAIRDRDALGFARIRVLAMEGIHLVVVFGENVTPHTLRTRAAENRIYVLHATRSRLSAYDPGGGTVGTLTPGDDAAPATRGGAVLELDIAQAASKEFAPCTNPFAERQPHAYFFAGEAGCQGVSR